MLPATAPPAGDRTLTRNPAQPDPAQPDPALLPTSEDVLATGALLAGHVVHTPLLESPLLSERTGARVLLKLETLQYTGAFKFRGAMSRLLRLTADERRRGVVAFSSGNHGQAIAAAGRRLDIPSVVVMPDNAPAVKLARTRAQGAEVVTYDPARERRETLAARIAEDRGLVLVPSYDDRWVIAGQGTAGLEILDDAAARGIRPDALIVCCGGGGLTAGCALAREARGADHMAIHTAEPAACDDHARSFAAGTILANAPGAISICDALLSPQPGDLTFAVNRDRVASGLVADDDEIRAAMRLAFEHLRLVLEPGGAAALATLLAGRLEVRGRTVVVMLSGGNVDAARFAEIIGADGPD